MTAQQLQQPVIEPAREVLFPDGLVFYECPRCHGFYNSRSQAETRLSNRRGSYSSEFHRCLSRPDRETGGSSK